MKQIILLSILIINSCNYSNNIQKPYVKKKDPFLERSSKMSKELYDRENLFIENYVKNDSIKFIQNEKYGFWYSVKDPKKKIKQDYVVSILYTVRKLNKNKDLLYHNKKLDFKVDKTNVITGINQGVKLLGNGQKGIFIFPSYLAYGITGDGDKIKTDAPLIYEIEVLDVKK